jgi:PTS system nitrogen regulatory IIA component
MTRLSAQDIARQLGLPASTIERWIRQGRIPAYQIDRECVFDQRELERWARAHNLTFQREPPPPQTADEDQAVDLAAVVRRGRVFYQVAGSEVAAVLRAAVAQVPIAEEARPLLLRRLLEREEMASTGIGNGIAIPHPRAPLHGVVTEPLITTCFLEQPVDFGAIDGKPVTTLFILLSPATKLHLHLLSQLAFRLRDDAFISFLASIPEPEQLWSRLSGEE